ncbi:hypothetical protein CRUP_033378, partial [Coryphaenoides rupestris]
MLLEMKEVEEETLPLVAAEEAPVHRYLAVGSEDSSEAPPGGPPPPDRPRPPARPSGVSGEQLHDRVNWAENTSCVLVQVEILEDWVDCRGVSSMPCLQATVNLSDFGRPALLHHNEDSLRLAPQALVVKGNLEELLGEAVSCLADSAKHPDAAILHRRYTLGVALFALQWPGLMLAGGALLVALVKLTQRQSL